MPTTLTPLGEINSTSYQDVAGLYAGMKRFPGETTTDFKNRLEINSNNLKQHNYEGTVENINTRLGLSLFDAISVNTTYSDAFLNYSFGALELSATEESLSIPTLTISPDGVWIWNTISSVVTAINASRGYTATLTSSDGPALQIARQSNSEWVVNEAVSARVYAMNFSGYVTGTATFNQTVNSFTIVNGILTTDQEYPGLTICYQYKMWPYSVVGSQAGVFSLVDPKVLPYIVTPSGALVYQVQEVIQNLMNANSTYWGK
jgi:hypothetical protein